MGTQDTIANRTFGDDCGGYKCESSSNEYFTLIHQSEGDYFIKVMSYRENIGDYTLNVLCAPVSLPPTNDPTNEPTMEPSTNPTSIPSIELTTEPSVTFTDEITSNPTTIPSIEPTKKKLTANPALAPSDNELLLIITDRPTNTKSMMNGQNGHSTTTTSVIDNTFADGEKNNMKLDLDSSIYIIVISLLFAFIAALFLYISFLKKKLRDFKNMNQSTKYLGNTSAVKMAVLTDEEDDDDDESNDEEIIGIIDLKRDKTSVITQEMITRIGSDSDDSNCNEA